VSGGAPPVAPVEQALLAGRKAVWAGRVEGLELADEQERYRVLARVNTPRCEGPAFEIQARDAWTRVILEAKEEEGEVARRIEGWRQAQARASGLGSRLLVDGRLVGERVDASGKRWPVFEVVAVVAELPPR
jgi:hypothetical protein